MPGSFRLKSGGQVDRSRPLRFTFDSRAYTGYEGDTLASALLAAGVSVVGRGLKFHRPRGVLTAGVEEPNALLTVGSGAYREPTVRATVQPLFDGLVAESQNRWPSLSFDLGRVNDVLHRLFPAGFYNKTFIWPSWHAFEPSIRRMAGLGVASEEPDPDRYEWRNAHCDVLVVGGGASGMLAASTAAASGAQVLLLESGRVLGGSLNWERVRTEPAPLSGVRVLLNTTAIGAYDHGLITAVEKSTSKSKKWRERWWRIRTKKIVLATGAFEQPLAFPFNDRPGIMLADAVRHYLNRYGVAAGERVSIVTNNDSAYQVVLDLHAAGINVPCLLDTRPNPAPELLSSMAGIRVAVHAGARITSTAGDRRIQSFEFTSPSASGRVECDALGMSGGWNPVAHLYCQAGGRLRFDEHHACLVPDGRLKSIEAVGAAAGIFDSPSRKQGATGALGYSVDHNRDRTWLDFQHDVTVADIDLAVRENLTSVEHVKRYTTVGMSIDQGKTSNLNALAILAKQTQRTIPEVGTTTFRPFFVPVTLGAIAGGRTGRFYKPLRLLPAHSEHEVLGAHFEDYGGWQRPACYPQPGETPSAAIQREVRAVRAGAGLFEGSPLGKFLVRGPDAAELLNRMYANTMRTLQAGKVRYGLMLNEQGVVIDDGVCARLSDHEFWVNTTGAGAARISAWLDEWLQCEWPQLQTVVTDVTSAFATLTVAGPKAREVLRSLPCDIDFSRDAFPHMNVRAGKLCGIPCRILRVSFTGELSYEISVPADFGAALWERLYAAGQPCGLVPFGIESLLVARLEKGYLHVGADTDGSTVPDDIGFGAAIAKKTGDFVGRRSLSLVENTRTDRFQLVGLRCKGDAQAFRAGAHLADAKVDKLPQITAGYLTSACLSPTLNVSVGLGLLRNGRARLGQTVHIVDGNLRSEAEVVNPSHYDPTGAHLND